MFRKIAKSRLYEELIPIKQLSLRVLNTSELSNAKIRQILNEVNKKMLILPYNGLIQNSMT
jgi:hypothetical protein